MTKRAANTSPTSDSAEELQRSARETLRMGARVDERRLQTLCLLITASVAFGFALFWLKPVLIPLGLALAVHLALTPLVDWLVGRGRLPRFVAAGVALLVAAGVLVTAGALAATSLRRVTSRASMYEDAFWSLTDSISDRVPFLEPLLAQDAVRERISQLPVQELLVGVTNAVVDLASNAVLVMVFVLFLVIGYKPNHRSESPLRRTIKMRVRRYLLTKLAASAATGVIVAAILAWLRVDMWMMFGMLVFGLNFIPSIGSILATLLPLPVVLVDPDVTVTRVLLVLLLPGSVQFTIGNLLEPKFLGDSLDLHPVTVLSALVFWGSLWGVVGMLLAAPITGVLKIMLQEIEITAPIAHLMAGRLDAFSTPPPPPIDS